MSMHVHECDSDHLAVKQHSIPSLMLRFISIRAEMFFREKCSHYANDWENVIEDTGGEGNANNFRKGIYFRL